MPGSAFPIVTEENGAWIFRTERAIGVYDSQSGAEAAVELWLDLKFESEDGRNWVDRLADSIEDAIERTHEDK